MVDYKVSCIAKNYRVDNETKLSINSMDKCGIKLYDAPHDPMEPVFLKKNQFDERDANMSSSDESDTPH